MTQYLKDYGERLAELGYRVVPLPPGSKGPHKKNWQKLSATPEQIKSWYTNGSANDGVGILAATTPAIDVDVMDPAIAQRMSDAIDRIFAGQALMTRTGRAPKFLIPFRSDNPFRKITSTTYTDGTNEHRIEILGDGQQWVAYHVHPGTGKPYEWFDGVSDDGIRSVAQSALPVLTESLAREVVDAFERIAAEEMAAGHWHPKSRKVDPMPQSRVDDDPFAAHAAPTGVDVGALLAKLPNDDCDYDRWLQVLMAVHHETNGEGEEIARAWSQQSPKHADEVFDGRWHSFGRNPNVRPVTLRTLLKDVKGERKVEKVEQKPLPEGFIQAASFVAGHRVEWHVKHVLPAKALSILYGEPGSGKSFFALDLVMSVAQGLAWRGHKTKQTPVAYIVAEGVAGFGNRLRAYAQHHDADLADIPLYVLGRSLTLEDHVVNLCESVEQLGAGLVVIDTLAAVSPGSNENTSEDMGRLIRCATLITEATGATVMFVHHANKTGNIRGWSGLLGAADQTIRIERDEDKRTAHMEKMKDGEDRGEFAYKLKIINLGEDEDGDAITSCVVTESDEVAPKKSGRKARGGDFEKSANFAKARYFLSIILELIADHGDVTESDVISAIQADDGVNPMGEENYPRPDNIKRTLLTLADQGKLRKEQGFIRVCG